MSYPYFALQIRMRQEKNIETLLRGRGYDPFLPVYEALSKWSDRTAKVELPLFPGYLFCRFDPTCRLPILTTPGVYKVVGNTGGPIPVDEADIERIRSVVTARSRCEPWPYVHVGQRMRIIKGPLCGVEGILLENKKKYRLVLTVSLLQRSVALEVDIHSVEPVRSAPVLAPSASAFSLNRRQASSSSGEEMQGP